MERRLSEFRSYMRGWMGYFGLARHVDPTSDTDVPLEPGVLADCQWRHPRMEGSQVDGAGSHSEAGNHTSDPT